MANLKDIYWAAGVIEGEGCFSLHVGRGITRPTIYVKMTDQDVILRLFKVFNLGNTAGPYKSFNSRFTGTEWKDAYTWKVANQEEVSSILMTLYPIMGVRRQEKIRECLATWRKNPIGGSRLTEKDKKEIYRLYYHTPLTQREIASKYNRTEKYVSSLIVKQRNMRKAAARLGNG